MESITPGQQFIVRSKRANAATGDDAPFIAFQFVGPANSQYPYGLVWDDKGSGAAYDVSIYRPQQLPDNYYILGDYAQNNYDAATGSVVIACAVNDDPSDPVFSAPTGYQIRWSTEGTGTDMEGSIWLPIAPLGYVAMGWVAQSGLSEPSLPQYMCVREDFVEVYSGPPTFIWDDRGSGSRGMMALYSPGVTYNYSLNIFIGQPNFDSFDSTMNVFKPA